MPTWKRGDLVELGGRLAVVVGVEGDPNVPEGHIAAWFGDPRSEPKSQGAGGKQPEVWTVPAEYFVAAAPPVWKH
jgi:hypothetical protein